MDPIWEILSVIGTAIFKVLPAGIVAVAHQMGAVALLSALLMAGSKAT